MQCPALTVSARATDATKQHRSSVPSLQNNVGGEDVHCRSLEQGFT
jgi:hypothetical protein